MLPQPIVCHGDTQDAFHDPMTDTIYEKPALGKRDDQSDVGTTAMEQFRRPLMLTLGQVVPRS